MLLPYFRSTLTQSPELIVPLPHVRESERVLDSGFHAVDSGFQEQISALSVERGFRISVLRKIPDSTSKNFRDSGIRISLHGASRCATAVLQVELNSIPSLNVARQNLKFKNALIFLWPWHEEPFPWKPLLQTQTWRSLFNGSVAQIALASHSGFCLQSNPVANIRLSSSTMESSESKKYARLSL